MALDLDLTWKIVNNWVPDKIEFSVPTKEIMKPGSIQRRQWITANQTIGIIDGKQGPYYLSANSYQRSSSW
jgi:hypothetical protein